MPQASKPSAEPILRSSTKEFELLLNDFYFRLEERNRWENQGIKYLLFGNGGGVALLMTFIGALSRSGNSIPALIIPLSFFLLGVIPIGLVVFISAKYAKEGRDGVRELLNKYICGEIEYSDAFLQMGRWPSRWTKARAALVASFGFFVAGIVASAAVYYFQPNIPMDKSILAAPPARSVSPASIPTQS